MHVVSQSFPLSPSPSLSPHLPPSRPLSPPPLSSSLPLSIPFSSSSLRLSDLHRHMRQQSRLVSMTTPITDEDPAGGVWPNVTSGGKGGKKGDILKLVCWASTLSLSPSLPLTRSPSLSFSLLFFLSSFSFSSTLAPSILYPLSLSLSFSPTLPPHIELN